MQKINPCLWFEHQAEEAARFYTSLFKNSKMGKIARFGEAGAQVSGRPKGSVMTVDFEIAGYKMVGLNGGPHFKFTPALSLFVWCETEAEIDRLWQGLSAGGVTRMGLDKYPWSAKYGWIADRFGVEWQLILGEQKQKIAPCLLFVKDLFGKGEEALRFYTSVFKNSKIETLERDESGKFVLHSVVSLEGQNFVIMDGQGPHNFTFSGAFSLMVNCENQTEVDRYWSSLLAGGTPEQCGWLRDKYGVSWQIVPTIIEKLMTEADPVKAERVMQALLKMTKVDIKTLEQA